MSVEASGKKLVELIFLSSVTGATVTLCLRGLALISLAMAGVNSDLHQEYQFYQAAFILMLFIMLFSGIWVIIDSLADYN
jgi:uncharacterized membrane protein YqjE